MATVYVSPIGAGAKDGSSWANAAPFSGINAMIQKAGAGGTVLLRADAGSYAAKATNITFGGTSDAPVTVKGVDVNGRDMPVEIYGSRGFGVTAATLRGGEVFVLSGGASNLKFQNIDFHDVLNAYRVKSAVSNIEIGNSDTSNVQRFFENRADDNSTTGATISGLSIHDIKVVGYSKNVIRLQYGTHDVKITNVFGNVDGQTFDDYAMGVHLQGTVNGVTLNRVTMLNNQNFLRDYWNGDGFATEGGVHHVTFIDTIARGSTDGGYDLKSDHTTLVRALAEDNGRNFRFWGNNNVMIDAVGLDPHGRKAGVAHSQVWMKGGADVTIKGGAFIDSGWDTRVFNFDENASVVLNGVTIQHASNAVLEFDASGLSGLSTSTVKLVAATGEWSTGSTWTGALVPASPPSASGVTGTAGADTLLGTAGVDSLSGLDGNDRLSGLAGNDMLKGGNGIDILIGGGGDDLLMGGSGTDVVHLSGRRADYGVRYSAGKLLIADLRSASLDGVETLDSIEKLQFAGGHNNPLYSISGSNLSDVLQGTSGKDTFFYDTALGLGVGADVLKSFGSGDRLVTTSALLNLSADAGDRFTFGGAEGSTGGVGSVKVWSVGGALRTKLALEQVQENDGIKFFVYKWASDTTSGTPITFGGDAAQAPTSALVSIMGSEADAPIGSFQSSSLDDTFYGAGDTDLFYFDTVAQNSGADVIRGFGSADRLVTRTQFLDPNEDGRIVANGSDRFEFLDGRGDEAGSVKIWSDDGKIVTSVVFDHLEVHEGYTYYVYRPVESLAGWPELVF